MQNQTAIIELEDVSVQMNGTCILNQVNLKLVAHDFLGIIGPNGGGKTTLLKAILGLIPPSKGKVTVLGTSPYAARKKIGYVPQLNNANVSFPITVLEVVLYGRLSHLKLLKRFGAKDVEYALAALETVRMLDSKDVQIGELSGGQRQRVFIARALCCEPEVLLLDEPTAHVDSLMQGELFELMNELKKRLTILLVTHDVGVISSYVNKIACLNKKLFFHDSKEIFKEDLEEVYQCPVDLIAHGIPHRVLKKHGEC
ncbi:metal ABC transporter ATP-binding protein [Candidatus Omnitrophota bacterium]